MSNEMDQSHETEARTQQKLSEGRERRQVMVSGNVNSWLALPVGASVLVMMAPAVIGNLRLVLIPYFEPRHRFVVDAPGVDSLAQRIRETGEAYDIAIIGNPHLARALYAGVDLDEEVPPEHYQAVAEVISYFWSLQGRAMPEERRRDE